MLNNIYYVKLKDIWGYVTNEKAPFILINIYLFFEYVRPQTLYPVIDIIPYSQTVLIFTTLILLSSGKFFSVANVENKLLVTYLAVIVLSSITAFSSSVSFSKVPDFLVWILIYFLIINIINSEKRFFIFMLAFLLYNFKMSQHAFLGWARRGFAFSDWGTGGGPGWFHNSGEFGIEMCIFFPLAYYFFISLKKYWPTWKKIFFFLFPFTAVTGMISSSSRGALVGGGATLIFIFFFQTKKKFRALIAILIIAFLVILFIPPEQKQRFESSGVDKTSITRVDRWNKGIELLHRYPVLGVGFDNWHIAVMAIYQDRRLAGECHNIFIECMAELGYSGLIVFLLMIFFTFINNNQTRKIARNSLGNNTFIANMAYGLDASLIGFLGSGFFVTVLYYPYFWINLAMTVALNNTAQREATGIVNG